MRLTADDACMMRRACAWVQTRSWHVVEDCENINMFKSVFSCVMLSGVFFLSKFAFAPPPMIERAACQATRANRTHNTIKQLHQTKSQNKLSKRIAAK